LRLIGDTCGVINAFKAGALDVVLLLESHTFVLGPAVMTESVHLQEVVKGHINAGRLTTPDDNSIAATTVASISGNYNLGIGESECIAICQSDPSLAFWSDDRRARVVAAALLGASRVIGTADLLRECVAQGLMSPLDAYTAYELARSRGAFLPPLDRAAFHL
jgi:predicted nucleic acid-binding protein